ncbi:MULTISPECIES: hypothetical protein [unclassified Saccharibacter]|uniref:hypothetical protein n=1 Tax=unclassified Saccharibacter TaxID=2648722 RepID=UPI0013207497|nr:MULTISPECIES: hypothetical protein [unclassified Saccharibacter]MXV35301.1 hypothetical protein [Saccharibacter sp. EH611]MXV57851.1 hypothetical protein [Saccharibacter sp. EH70]MXV65235.1 hypothetical protein [Saccharibacter sp. EH60]
MSDSLEKILISELTEATDSAVSELADYVAHLFKAPPLGILFYGSVLRETDYEGILDFYVITDRTVNLSHSSIGRLANKILPPNVYYVEHTIPAGKTLRAKVAVLSLSQFLARSTLESRDSTIWARFCQPVRLVWVRNNKAADGILEALRRCVITASCWAALLGPYSGTAEDYWHDLFARTYKAELRVEKKGRSRNLLTGREKRYKTILLAAWHHASLSADVINETLQPHLTPAVRLKAHHKWGEIQKIGHFLNVVRLLKAAFTFSDGIKYLLWKIQRHTGEKITLSSFEMTHPILSLPLLLWRFRHIRSAFRK